MKRAFRLEFGDQFRVGKISLSSFESVYKTFKSNGFKAIGVEEKGSKANHKHNVETTNKVRELFSEQNPSVREASRAAEIPKSTVHWHMKEKLDMKFFKVGNSDFSKISSHGFIVFIN